MKELHIKTKQAIGSEETRGTDKFVKKLSKGVKHGRVPSELLLSPACIRKPDILHKLTWKARQIDALFISQKQAGRGQGPFSKSLA